MRDDCEPLDLPPHSIPAEQSLLGALFFGEDAFRKVQGDISADDFYDDQHRVIFEHITQCVADGKPVDVLIVQASLERDGKLEGVGGLSYLSKLIEGVPTAANARHYARIVHDRAELRRVANEADSLSRAAMRANGGDSDDLRRQLTALTDRAQALNERRWSLPAPINANELTDARLTPDCIVDNYLYADVALLVAPGGTGKTTLILFEAVCIVLGLPLYGNTVRKAGPVLLVTAEDSRQMLIARMRAIAEALNLDDAQRATVMRDIRIADVSGSGFKLSVVVDGEVRPSPAVNALINECRPLRPVLIVFDPAVSFGVGEQRVNDAEQALVEAARRIRNEIGCCVRYVHHVGKVNAREKATDQYAGRGGSTFADGARMVAVLQPLKPDEWRTATGASLLDGEQGLVLARPKLSYCTLQRDILITRKGFAFTHTSRVESDAATDLEARCAQVLQMIEHATAKGERPTQNSLESRKIMPKGDLRGALATLSARGRVITVKATQKGGPQHFLQVQAAPPGSGAPTEISP